ncbi:MAG: UvrD-helicase domain-containing protein [Clostridia bacterium]|nr:UvrD-helicase domain-containing protein [Clostridia bacterium]
MPQWTADQRRVIESEARELICGAAAGSGKTAVLVERIVRFLKTGMEPESFLIITFTNAAASEMREKIRQRLLQEREEPLIRAALDRMDLMQISTIHSFCQQLLRGQFQFLDLDPLFTICDASQGQKLFHEAFLEACDQMESDEPDLFVPLKQRYDGPRTEKIIQKLQSFLMSLPEPMAWLEDAVKRVPDRMDPAHPWFSSVQRMVQEKYQLAEMYLGRMEKMLQDAEALENYQKSWQVDQALFHVKQSELHQENPVFSACVFARLSTPRGLTPQEMDWKDRYQKLRDSFKKQMGEADSLLMLRPEETLEEWENLSLSLKALAALTEKTQTLFQEKKKRRALVDFQDLEQYAVTLLSDPAIQAETRSVWRNIFVDECQDVSAVQDRLISLLQSPENRLFMVGDVKQSIYRFRLADPLLFLGRIDEMRQGKKPGGECVFLQANFRSRPEILETTNLVFRSVMKKTATEMDYAPEDELVPGRRTEGSVPVRVDMLAEGDGDLSELERTAAHVAEEIRELLRTPYPGKERNYQYRDCVILMPGVASHGPKLAEMLSRRSIPVFFDGMGDYYQQQEILVMKNLLEWIENPLQDLPLISVLTHPPFSLSEEQLSLIRLHHPDAKASFHEAFDRECGENSQLGEACRAVRSRQKKWQELSESMRLSDFLWQLLQESGLYWVYALEPGGAARQANLRMLVEEAARGEANGMLTLRQFLTYLRDQQRYGDQQSATLLGDQDDLVRIMTIHKSKGLQFPVVFCCGMDQELTRAEEGGIQCHARLGLCVDYKDPAHRIARPTLATRIFAWQKRREELAEKVRLLYVAMTRAQERLYLITCQETNPLWSMPENEGRILSARTYTDLWMPVLLRKDGSNLSTGCTQPEKPYEIKVFEQNPQETVEKRKNIHNLEAWLESLLSAPVVDELWKESPEETSPTLVKRSVTSLIRAARLETEDLEEESPEIKRMPEAIARRLTRYELEELPRFLQESPKTTASWRGTLTHRVLSGISLTDMRNGISPAQAVTAEKERMLREHILTPEEARQIRDAQIISFFQSSMGQRMIRAREVHREWNFNLRIQRDREMILQGVIDCAFLEEDGWVILDYKTDRVPDPEAFVAEYTPQLRWYTRAVGELTGQRVKEAALYSLTLDQVFPVFLG